ncbi:decarboxylating 6-phosphogluconate dehydrogenase [archaeon]|nr:decarboxylating 6-phosphogluconate dehydrogenase [archaeon]
MGELGFIGLGRMGNNMVMRLLEDNHKVTVFDQNPGKVKELVSKGAAGSESIKELVSKLSKPRIIWVMVPSGEPVKEVLNELKELLDKDDIVIDGGNSNFHETMSRAAKLKEIGVTMMDAGTSGGLSGADKGYCMMVGGDREAYDEIEPIIKSLCMTDGYAYISGSGSGHYVKMIHNAIEYGMMQSIAEGFDLLANGRFKDLDLEKISRLWNHGSIISSFLLRMAEKAFTNDPELESLKPYVDDSGEGRWAVKEAVEQRVPFMVNTQALYSRFASRDDNSMANRLLAAIRREFGGHSVKKKKE